MKDLPACDLVLASAHRVAGTIDAATFDVRLAQDLKGPVRVVLRDFVVSSSNNIGTSIPLHVSLPQALNTTCFDTTTGGPTGHLATIAPPTGVFCAFPPTGLPNTFSPTVVTGQAYGNGTYTITAPGWNGARVFDYNTGTSVQSSLNYNTNTGLPLGTAQTTTATNGVTYTGDYMQLTLPQPIQLQQYTIWQGSDVNKVTSQHTLLGSRDGTTWDQLDSRAYADVATNSALTRTVSPPLPYSWYRLVIQRNGNAATTNFRSASVIAEVRYVGTAARAASTLVDAGFVTDSSLFQRPLQVSVKPSDGVTWAAQDWAARLSILPCSM
jgi:hypothetical protein